MEKIITFGKKKKNLFLFHNDNNNDYFWSLDNWSTNLFLSVRQIKKTFVLKKKKKNKKILLCSFVCSKEINQILCQV